MGGALSASFWELLGLSWGSLGSSFGPLDRPKRASRFVLELSWASFARFLLPKMALGGFWGRPWLVLVLPRAFWGVFWPPSNRFRPSKLPFRSSISYFSLLLFLLFFFFFFSFFFLFLFLLLFSSFPSYLATSPRLGSAVCAERLSKKRHRKKKKEKNKKKHQERQKCSGIKRSQ